jgi:3',5'-cyclic-AMP phosphodiesterase
MLIAQITDTHLIEKNENKSSNPLIHAGKRLTRILSYLSQLTTQPDVVLLTGDASDSGSRASYDHLKEVLRPLKIPLYVIPGNHDCREELRQAFSNHSYIPKQGFIHYMIDDYPVRLIGLDTYISRESPGLLCEERFSWLKQVLGHQKEKPTLIFMHHPPVKTGKKAFDSISCAVPVGFEQLISKQTNLLGIVSGHYHHLCFTTCGGKLCFVAPAIVPNYYFIDPHTDLSGGNVEIEDPAVTLHQWHGEDKMTSHVMYIKN